MPASCGARNGRGFCSRVEGVGWNGEGGVLLVATPDARPRPQNLPITPRTRRSSHPVATAVPPSLPPPSLCYNTATPCLPTSSDRTRPCPRSHARWSFGRRGAGPWRPRSHSRRCGSPGPGPAPWPAQTSCTRARVVGVEWEAGAADPRQERREIRSGRHSQLPGRARPAHPARHPRPGGLDPLPSLPPFLPHPSPYPGTQPHACMPVQQLSAVGLAGGPVVGRVSASLGTAHGSAQGAAVRGHPVCQPACGVRVAVKGKRHQAHALQLHAPRPRRAQPRKHGPRQLGLQPRHVDQVRAHRAGAVRVRRLQAKLRAPVHVLAVPERRVLRRAAVRPRQRAVGVPAPFAGVTLVWGGGEGRRYG